jgi:signal transduction histidine kinase
MLGIAVGVSALFGAYVLLATFATEDLGKTPLSYPPLSSGLAVLTIALLVVAAGVQLFGRSPAPGTLRFFLAISFLMLAEAQISLAIAPPWTLAWWEYHGLMASAVGLALASLHWDLDRRQVAREAEQQAQLVAAQSEAEAARRAEALKRDVIAIVSHELRTPLTAVRGFSELLLTRNVSEQQRELWLQTMYQETTAIATMLDELLDVSRLEDGALPLDIEAVALGETIERVATGFRAEGSAYQILVELPASEVMVLADRDRLAQILQNLVSNAIKYSPGGGEVRISASQSGANALVQVRDRGLGIPAHEIERLFSRFHRVHSPERVSIRGTGLGLFITQQLVARQGGEIWAQSQTEEGSTFSFTLPLAPATQR